MTTFWRVASLGYPNPFGDNNARRSWAIFLSFTQHNSYRAVKDYWSSAAVTKQISPHSVETRKSSLEEFGLLYVLSGSDAIVITPGGRQLLAAAEALNQKQFAWVGINLLMRFPLQGPPRSRVSSNVASDFPIYGFLYTALCELDNFVWFEELIRVLGLVTDIDSAQKAIDEVRKLRTGERTFKTYPTMPDLRGVYYNSMNQVVNHIGLAGLTLASTQGGSPYIGDLNRRETLLSSFSEIVRLAIGQRGNDQPEDDCVVTDQFISRMPVLPLINDEQDYFAYLGAGVPDLDTSRAIIEEALPQVLFGQENVNVLTEGVHYSVSSDSIFGEVSTLCRVARGQRLILSHDLGWTYKVKDKRRVAGGRVAIDLVRSKEIVNSQSLQAHFVVNNNG
ncbi:hypothetical protein E3T24_05680 [Cryobacterium sp. TmT2-59]|uniref:hypothetical protein n=1 Tax=Cryobacterium sp. TmT2-59 TaxID=1259264 RepID=UPI00106A83B8|nr:hypothetical protein [Cryobacterium sp. TmT2-59]TFC87152.1 hypothetical protein E3T24_05680 [Cryobacterium sp. TmT2-59]